MLGPTSGKLIFCSKVGFVILAWIVLGKHGLYGGFRYELACYDNLVYTALILLVILQKMDHDRFILQWGDEAFWFIAAILLYAPLSVFVLSIWEPMHMQHPPQVIRLARAVNDMANAMLYIGFAIGLARNRKASQSFHL